MPLVIGSMVFLIATTDRFFAQVFVATPMAFEAGGERQGRMQVSPLAEDARPLSGPHEHRTSRRLTTDGGAYAIALACIAIALATAAMEIVLFTANIAGVALVLSGLALVAHDGFLALCGYALTGGVAGAILYYVF